MHRLGIFALVLVLSSCSNEPSGPTPAGAQGQADAGFARIELEVQRAEESPAGAPALDRDASEELPMQPIEFAGEERVGQIVRRGWRAAGRARSPSADSRVALAFGVLDGVPDGELALRARVLRDSLPPLEERWKIGRSGRWIDAILELGLAPGEPFELVLELEAGSDVDASLALAQPVVYTPSSSPQTVLFVTSDTHRGDHVEGADRAAALRTPALRELASRGVFFTDCYSSTNITVSSHVAMLTGQHPRDTGITDNRTPVSDGAETLAEVFRAQGYRTFAATSVDLLSPPHSNVGQGFDIVSWPMTPRAAGKTVAIALRNLDETPDRPVFCWVHLFDAHGPYEPPKPFDREFYPAGRDPRDPALEPQSGARIPPYLAGVRDLEYIRALYRGEIGFLDSQLARLFAHPRVASGVVAFTGDHGEELGAHDIWWAHKDLYPDSLHVPLIVAWPGAPENGRSEAPVVNVDVGRTLLDLAGLEARAFPGHSLIQRTGEARRADEPRFALGAGRAVASINDGGWHLILQLAAHNEAELHDYREVHQAELYDLKNDPTCSHDLLDVQAHKAKELRAKLIEWLLGWQGERFAQEKHADAATLEGLAQLGYASDAIDRDAGAPLFDPSCACAWCTRFR